MARPRILISGAGIAGPALAYWLARAGWRVVVVERAPALRPGGQAVDFRGPVHRAVLERMGIWETIHQQRTRPGPLTFVDRAGRVRVRLPEVMMSGDVEILRGDLARILADCTRDGADYRFGDRVVALVERAGAVVVRYARGGEETFDAVVGADGLHSGVRALAQPDEPRALRHRGHRIATFALSNPLPFDRGAACLSEPGRGACVYALSATDARALLVYTAPPISVGERDADGQRQALAARFGGMGWVVPRVLEALAAAPAADLYSDAIATVHVGRYAWGRVGLLGDAAWGGTLGGQGTSLAIVGAYVLAHELGSGTDPAAAFARYEARMRPYATRCQRGATHVGGFFAPRTRLGLALRDLGYRVLTSRRLAGFFERLVKDAATHFALPEYPASAADSGAAAMTSSGNDVAVE